MRVSMLSKLTPSVHLVSHRFTGVLAHMTDVQTAMKFAAVTSGCSAVIFAARGGFSAKKEH